MTNEELFKRYHLSPTKVYTPIALTYYSNYILHINRYLPIDATKD